MGITIYAKGVDMRFNMNDTEFFFLRQSICQVFHKKLAEAFGDYQLWLDDIDEWKANLSLILADPWFDEYNEDIVDFLVESDCAGEVWSYYTCQKLYRLIKNVDFKDKSFRYAAYTGIDLEDFKVFLKKCCCHRARMKWD